MMLYFMHACPLFLNHNSTTCHWLCIHVVESWMCNGMHGYILYINDYCSALVWMRGMNITCMFQVGYTNAGKSTLLNRLTGADVLAEDKLFATLDPTTRRVQASINVPKKHLLLQFDKGQLTSQSQLIMILVEYF